MPFLKDTDLNAATLDESALKNANFPGAIMPDGSVNQ
jgi:uncharacterized protein YjbI with pentapeptide repeats